MKAQSGFTLIELVMVIVILGILSAFAVPRFADLGKEAREASLAGLAGAIKSAAAISHAEQLVNGYSLGESVTLDGQTVAMVNGYPAPNMKGIGVAAGVNGDRDFKLDGGAETGGTTIKFTLRENCFVEYTSANAVQLNVAPITSSYAVRVTANGCG